MNKNIINLCTVFTSNKKIKLFNAGIIICLLTTPVYGHIKCPIKFLGTTNDKCPHIHRRERTTEESTIMPVPDYSSKYEQQQKRAEQLKKQRQAQEAEANRRRRAIERRKYEQALQDQQIALEQHRQRQIQQAAVARQRKYEYQRQQEENQRKQLQQQMGAANELGKNLGTLLNNLFSK